MSSDKTTDGTRPGEIPLPKTRQQQAREWISGVRAALEVFGLIDEETAAHFMTTPEDFEGPDEGDFDAAE